MEKDEYGEFEIKWPDRECLEYVSGPLKFYVEFYMPAFHLDPAGKLSDKDLGIFLHRLIRLELRKDAYALFCIDKNEDLSIRINKWLLASSEVLQEELNAKLVTVPIRYRYDFSKYQIFFELAEKVNPYEWIIYQPNKKLFNGLPHPESKTINNLLKIP